MTQNQALKILLSKANVFLTGQPGAGKSYTINQFVEACEAKGIYPAITASTGIASTHIGGTTIHSWSGIGIDSDMDDDQIHNMLDLKHFLRNKIAQTKVLIIDEISMLDAGRFELIDRICRVAKMEKDIPFGGIQVILVGDFFQLPPVSKKEEKKAEFVFNSPIWEQLNMKVCYLTEQHRQDDMDYLELLTAMRNGEVKPKHHKLLQERVGIDMTDKKITKLYTHNADVDVLNTTELRKLKTKLRSFGMEKSGMQDFLIKKLVDNCLSPEILKLKVGALVMFTFNDNEDKEYVNGTLGEVVGFKDDDHDGLPIVRKNDGMEVTVGYQEWNMKENHKVVATIKQIPLRLAWAITVHKAQGMSLDAANIDLNKAFEYGQGYVALSRVKSLKGLFLDGINEHALLMHPEVVKKDAEFIKSSLMLED